VVVEALWERLGLKKTLSDIVSARRLRIDRGAIREAARYDGKWAIETNNDTIRLADAAFGYKGLVVIEGCCRSLKRT
jgi:hypothetical protein